MPAKVPQPLNEPVLAYAPGSPEKQALKRALESMAAAPVEIPLVDRRRSVRTGTHRRGRARRTPTSRCWPGRTRPAPTTRSAAIDARRWRRRSRGRATPLHERLAVFLRAAELLASKYRPILNAATMLGQSKTAHQAEIDAACESIDFWRFNVALRRAHRRRAAGLAAGHVEPARRAPARRLRVRGHAVQLHRPSAPTCRPRRR